MPRRRVFPAKPRFGWRLRPPGGVAQNFLESFEQSRQVLARLKCAYEQKEFIFDAQLISYTCTFCCWHRLKAGARRGMNRSDFGWFYTKVFANFSPDALC